MSPNSFATAIKITSPSEKNHRTLLTLLSFANISPSCLYNQISPAFFSVKKLLYSIGPLFFLWHQVSWWDTEWNTSVHAVMSLLLVLNMDLSGYCIISMLPVS